MKLNSVMVVYWIILLLLGCSAFYFIEDDVITTIETGLYLIVVVTTLSLLFTIGKDTRNDYSKDVIYLACLSLALHIFNYVRSAIVNDLHIIANDGLPSTLLSLSINALLLAFMYVKTKVDI